MFQKNAQAKSSTKQVRNLDEQLAAYYGPALPPHVLSEAAWLHLRDRLDQVCQDAPRGRHMRQLSLGRARRSPAIPPVLQATFAELLAQINYRHPSPELRCHFSAHRIQPRVRFMPLGRGQIHVMLPAQSWQFLQAIELEVLLTVGLARAAGASRALFVLVRAFFAASFLLTLAMLPFTGADRRYLWLFCLALACCMAGAGLIFWQERTLAFRGDRQAVQWLGRERVCRGLHLLAEHGRPPRRLAWGEPSLNERIARVCGSPVKTKDEHLTLVG
jgi:hypothetical protein